MAIKNIEKNVNVKGVVDGKSYSANILLIEKCSNIEDRLKLITDTFVSCYYDAHKDDNISKAFDTHMKAIKDSDNFIVYRASIEVTELTKDTKKSKETKSKRTNKTINTNDSLPKSEEKDPGTTVDGGDDGDGGAEIEEGPSL